MSAAPLPADVDRVALFSTLNRSRVVPGGGTIDGKLLALNPSFTRTFDPDDHGWTKLIRGGWRLPRWRSSTIEVDDLLERSAENGGRPESKRRCHLCCDGVVA